MDPNTTPPTQPAATPDPATNPVAPTDLAQAAAPAATAPAAAPASPIPSPASPVAPAEPIAPVAPTPTAPVAQTPVNADVANAALNPPVNPVVAPGAPAATPGINPAVNAAPAAGSMSMNQMFQTQPAAPGVLDETTAIAVPEGPKPPDPVEEELKAPLKAAGPVPGSIGSAVSMPPAEGQPQNVAFNDPAQGGQNPMTAGAPDSPAAKKPGIMDKLMAKTKMNKNTLILLAVVTGLIVVVLVVVLVMVATGVL